MHPYIASIEITNNCNLSCRHCYLSKDKYYLSFFNFKKIIDRLIYENYFFIRLTGGEPLLHPDFKKMVEYLNSKNIAYGINTNAFFLSESILLFLKKNNLSTIRLSLDGLEKNNNFIRNNPNSFSNTLSAIKLLNKNKISFSVNCCVMKTNLFELDKILLFLKKHKVKEISFNLIKSNNNTNKSENIDVIKLKKNKEFRQMILRFRKEILKDEKIVQLDSFLFSEVYDKKKTDVMNICGAGKDNIYIDVFGDVFYCQYFKTTQNIFTAKKLFFKINDKLILCDSCKYKSLCLISCPAYTRAYILRNNYDEVNCPYIS